LQGISVNFIRALPVKKIEEPQVDIVLFNDWPIGHSYYIWLQSDTISVMAASGFRVTAIDLPEIDCSERQEECTNFMRKMAEKMELENIVVVAPGESWTAALCLVDVCPAAVIGILAVTTNTSIGNYKEILDEKVRVKLRK
jgi:hypothetical protein